MHTVFLHCARCRATASGDMHRESRVIAIVVIVQLEETKNSEPSDRYLNFMQGNRRMDRTESTQGLVPTWYGRVQGTK